MSQDSPAAAVPRSTHWAHWFALLAAAGLAARMAAVGFPGPAYAAPAAMLGYALLGRAVRRCLAWVLALGGPSRPHAPWWLPAGTAAVVGLGAAWRTFGPALLVAGGCLVGLALILSGWFALRHGQPSSPVKRESDRTWLARVEEEWPSSARAAGLTHPDAPEVTAPLVGQPVGHGRAALALRVGLDAVLAAPEDVAAGREVLRRRLRADHVRVEPAGIDEAVVRAYRRHPLDVYVTWRQLRPTGAGEWVPFGLTEAGRQAVLRWRLSTVLFGIQDSGKTMVIRAFLAGLVRQEVPHRLWLWDNRADFRPLASVAHRYAVDASGGLDLLRELAGHMDRRIRTCPDLDRGYLHRPTLADPADILVVSELLSAQSGPRSDVSGLLRRIPAEGRPVSVAMLATAQTSLKEVVGPIRDLFPQRVATKLWDASLVDPALGDGALDRGGDAHLIPASLPGVALLVDPATGWPVMVRGADVPPEDTDAALVDPYRELMGRGRSLRVIDGELADGRLKERTGL